MKKLIIIFSMIITLASVSFGCSSSCVTGKVQSMYDSDGEYYLVLSEEQNFQFTGNSVTLSVDRDFYYSTSPSHTVTVCR